MVTGTHRLRLPDIEPEWTPRQRQVLDLLVAGRTNSEIAQELGVSLEGAKWHVSEILSKLGVERREEAAEYWRYRNGMRMRFARIVRSATTAAALRWLALAAGGLAIVSGVAVAAVLAFGDEGDANPATVSPEPTSTPVQTSQPTPSASPVTGLTTVDRVIDAVTRRDEDAFKAMFQTTSRPCTDAEFHIDPQCDGAAEGTPIDTVFTFACEGGWQPVELLAGSPVFYADGYTLYGVSQSGRPVRPPAETTATYWVFFLTSNPSIQEGFGVAVGAADSGEEGIVAYGTSCGPLPNLIEGSVESGDEWVLPPGATGTGPADGPLILQPGTRGLIGFDSIAYYGVTCYACGGELNLFRAHTVGGGLFVEELLPGTTGLPRGSFYTFAADFESGEMYVAACVQGSCGPESDVGADSQNIVLRSTDGGVTWSEFGSLPEGASLAGVLSDGRLLIRSSSAGFESYFYGDGLYRPPPPPAPFEGFAFVDASGNLFWRDRAGEQLYDESGAEIVLELPAGSTLPMIFDRSGGGDPWATWVGADGRAAFGRFDAGAAPDAWELAGSWTGGELPVDPVQLMPGLASVAARATYPEEPCFPPGCDVDSPPRVPAVEAAIVDLQAGVIHPIPELSEGLSGNSHPFLRAIVNGVPYMTVNTPGDCLNLRDAPSASGAVITCVADRVLLGQNGNTVTADGTSWQPVRLWDGREGWVAGEFLLRQSP